MAPREKDELARLINATVARLAGAWRCGAGFQCAVGDGAGRAAGPVGVAGAGHFSACEGGVATLSGVVAVLGVASLASSPEIGTYIANQADGHAVQVVNASSMVELVESGAFLNDPAGTQAQVNAFMQQLLRKHPGLDVCTLSSTHLPWLAPFFQRAAPAVTRSSIPQKPPRVRCATSSTRLALTPTRRAAWCAWPRNLLLNLVGAAQHAGSARRFS